MSNRSLLCAAALAAGLATSATAQPVKTFTIAMPPLETNYFLSTAPLNRAALFDGGIVEDAYADISLFVEDADAGSGITSSGAYFLTQVVLPVDIDFAAPDVQAPGVLVSGETLGWEGTGRFTARVPLLDAVGGAFQVPFFFTSSTTGYRSETEQIFGRMIEARSNWVLVVRNPAGVRTQADYNGDGAVDITDFGMFMEAYQAGSVEADFSGDLKAGPDDVAIFVRILRDEKGR